MYVQFSHSEKVARNIKTFWFKPEGHVRYTAGQFVELILPHSQPDDRGEKRWFTLSSSPTEPLLSITTKFASPGPVSSFKTRLARLKSGEQVMMSGPMGDFVLPKDPAVSVVFVAGGIGVTPMRSMIKWLLDNNQPRKVKLIYAVNVWEDAAFLELFKQYALQLILLPGKSPPKRQGFASKLTAERVLKLAPDIARQRYYLAGPEPMVESLYKDMAALGINEQKLVTDYFPGYQAI